MNLFPIQKLALAVLCCTTMMVIPKPLPAQNQVDDKTLYKLLINGKEMMRLRGIAYIHAQPRIKFDSLPTLIRAAKNQVERLRNRVPSPSTVALFRAIGSTSHSSANDFLCEQLKSPNQELVLLTLDIIRENQLRESIDALNDFRTLKSFRERYAIRSATAKALWAMSDTRAIKVLTEIYHASDGQLRFDIRQWYETSEQATSLELPDLDEDTDPSAPTTGKTDKEKDLEKERLSEAIDSLNFDAIDDISLKFSDSGSVPGMQFEEPEYYGIKLHAKRILFLLDHSGSMRELDGNTTRLNRAKAELIYTITSLPSDYEFSILIYATRTRWWRRELLVADRKNKTAAIEFVKKIGYGDKTNTHAALMHSLEFDPSLEAVYLLSDGRPTLGAIIDPNLIVKDVTLRNRFRHLKFNTIGIAVGGFTTRFLKTLAVETGGEFREVR